MEVSKHKVGPACESLEYIDNMRMIDQNRLKSLAAGGVDMWHCIHEPGDLLYIPQGFICVESSVSALPSDLIFGFRKSIMAQTELAIQEYEACISLFAASARDTTRMTFILDCMKAGRSKE